MADEKETKNEEVQDLEPKKDPKGGMVMQSDEPGKVKRGETPRFIG